MRPEHFVTKKIVTSAKRIAAGSPEKLVLGRLDIMRDWGWAPEYVEAMWMLLQQNRPEDFVVATGVTTTLEEFVSATFDYVGLDWRQHVVQDAKLYRPSDVQFSFADPSKIERTMGWKAKTSMPNLVHKLMASDIENHANV